jgi:3-dehydroquinate synthase
MIGEKIANLKKYFPARKMIIITDSIVRHHYEPDFPSNRIIEIGTGEKIKNLDTVRTLYGKLIDLGVDRSSCLVGIGGGIVCDIAGFVASTYMRGVRFAFVASTLLSQVDASTGGKNGVNYDGYKNMVGVFNQPECVICDLDLLKTLPEREIRCGFSEIVKHAAIADAGLFSYLEKNFEDALSLKTDVMEKLIYDSIVIKSSIVNKDEKEKGERRKLNFGHTLGHAIENATGLPHGEAVSMGMVFASALSAKRGYLPQRDVGRIKTLLRKLKLPTKPQFDGVRVLDAIERDKKKEGERIHFVMLQGIGHAVVEEISMNELKDIMKDMGKEQ